MSKETIQKAATVEEAKAAAVRELGVPEEQIEFEVIKEPQKKAFGLFGGSEAEVRATVKASGVEAAVAYVKNIMTGFGRDDVSVTAEGEGRETVIRIEGEHLGFIIGRRGDTLDALQYLVSLVANRQGGDYIRVTLDVGDYRAKRREALVELGRRIGNQVIKSGRRASLEAMSPYERRVIHTTVSEIEGVTSWSVGDEPYRHVVVGLDDENAGEGDAPQARSGGNRQRRGGRGGNNRPRRGERSERRDSDVLSRRPERTVRAFVPRSNPLPTADDITPPSRTQSEAESTATLYGRIDL